MFKLTTEKIEDKTIEEKLFHEDIGAVITFKGVVRNHNDGHPVTALDYEAYPEMVEKIGDEIVHEAGVKFDVEELRCIHRVGHLDIGEMALFVAVSAYHRKDAFRAVEYIVDEIKLRLPVWKKEHYQTGQSEWLEGTRDLTL